MRLIDPVAERVEAAFSDDDARRYSSEYLKTLTENWREVALRTRTTLLALVALAVIFQLLRGRGEGQLNLGPVRVVQATDVVALLPLVSSFLFYELIVLVRMDSKYDRLHFRLMQQLYPSISNQHLDYALHPVTPTLLEDHHWLRHQPASGPQRLWARIGAVSSPLTVLAILAVQLLMLVQAIVVSGSLLTWFAMAVACVPLLRGLALLGTIGSETRPETD